MARNKQQTAPDEEYDCHANGTEEQQDPAGKDPGLVEPEEEDTAEDENARDPGRG